MQTHTAAASTAMNSTNQPSQTRHCEYSMKIAADTIDTNIAETIISNAVLNLEVVRVGG